MQVSNYFILQDAPIVLSQFKRFEVEMPSATQFQKSTARPILLFRMIPRTDHLKFIVLLNDFVGDPNPIAEDKIVFLYDFNGSRHRVLRDIHEVLNGNDFITSAINVIDFRVIIGEMELADVVLFFRVET